MPTPCTGFRRGYTLPEIIIALAVFTAFGAMILILIVNVTKSLATSENKGALNINFHNMTSVLSPLVSGADFVYVFNTPGTSATSPIATAGSLTPPNSTGDVLVAVYYANPGYVNSAGVTNTTVSRIAGVCRVYNSTSKTYPIYMFDYTFAPPGQPTVASAKDLIPLLPTMAKVLQGRQLADSSSPVDTQDKGGGIFLYNGNGTGAIMMALLSSGRSTQTVSNAYTCSISSRNL